MCIVKDCILLKISKYSFSVFSPSTAITKSFRYGNVPSVRLKWRLGFDIVSSDLVLHGTGIEGIAQYDSRDTAHSPLQITFADIFIEADILVVTERNQR